MAGTWNDPNSLVEAEVASCGCGYAYVTCGGYGGSAPYDDGCADSANGATDSYGDGCYWYDWYPGDCGWYDTSSFSANDMCCSCGGGDYSGSEAESISWNGECDESGQVDSYGDGCDWYDNNVWGCGFYDTLHFQANDMCCACVEGEPDATGGDGGGCQDTTDGATDSYGDGCEWYDNYPCGCGYYDDGDFVADDMCCSCGGGATGSAESESEDEDEEEEVSAEGAAGFGLDGEGTPNSHEPFFNEEIEDELDHDLWNQDPLSDSETESGSLLVGGPAEAWSIEMGKLAIDIMNDFRADPSSIPPTE